MPPLKTYRLFISHAWQYNDAYYRAVTLLNDATNFSWANHSDPEHDPLVDPATPVGKRTMTNRLSNQIQGTHCVLIIAGMYAAYREWIQAEIDLAVGFGKPIIGLIPWGQERTPTAVQNVAHAMVGWNTSSIVSAIRTHSL